MYFWSGIRDLYLTNRLLRIVMAIVLLFVLSYTFPRLFRLAEGLLFVLIALIVFDVIRLFQSKKRFIASRACADRFSNGDENDILLNLESRYAFPIDIRVIDEIPHQFQVRDLGWYRSMPAHSDTILTYRLRPVKRGEYSFGALNVYVATQLGLIRRRFRFEQGKTIAVYPSYLQMRKYELAALSHQLSELGIKKIRRIGQTLEFEQIKKYVHGDDPRTINWKATARTRELMVNQYVDERSQQVYSVVDKGRLMRMPFDKMSLLDYAINASLVISNIAIKKEDRAGLITFSNKMSTVVPAEKKPGHLYKIQQALYHQRTKYLESNFELLSAFVNRKINQRSLLLLYTNFESLTSFKRQLPYFRSLARRHVVVIIFFQNTGLQAIIEDNPTSIKAIYTQTIAEQFEYEKRLIVSELRRAGIYSILTPPQALTVNTINKYLQLKAMGIV